MQGSNAERASLLSFPVEQLPVAHFVIVTFRHAKRQLENTF